MHIGASPIRYLSLLQPHEGEADGYPDYLSYAADDADKDAKGG